MSSPYDHLRQDPELARLIDDHGELPLDPHPDPFERLVTSIVNQQLSTASAAAIRERLFDQFEITPDAMLAAEQADLEAIGLSSQKIRYVRNVADAFQDGLDAHAFDAMSDDEVVDELTAITGVGVWTAKMFLMFCLAREDVFPVEDLGIRNGMAETYDIHHRDEMEARAEEWRPYRSYASQYLWRVVD